MADIAMLVAEEYERMVKISRTRVGADQKQEEIHLVSCAAVLARNIKARIGHQRIQALKLALEPKTPIATAAFTGAFSA